MPYIKNTVARGSRTSVRAQTLDASPRTLSTRQHVVALKRVVLEEVESDYNDRLTGVTSHIPPLFFITIGLQSHVCAGTGL